VWCSVVQCVAVCCSVLQCVAVWCSVLQCVCTSRRTCHDSFICDICDRSVFLPVGVCCSVVQCVAVWYSVLQCVAVWCSVFLPIGAPAMTHPYVIYVTVVYFC